MSNVAGAGPDRTEPLDRRRDAIEEVVQCYAGQLSVALDSGNVAEIEGALYAFFDQIYDRAFRDGQAALGVPDNRIA